MAEARTSRAWPYRAAKPGRTRRVIKTSDPGRGVHRPQEAAPRFVVTKLQARIAFAFALVAIVATGAWYAYHSPWLTIQHITVNGTVRISPAQVQAAAALRGESGFGLDTNAAQARVGAVPNVRSVSIKQLGWDSVRIDVEERVPWGSWQIQGVNVPIDVDGYVLDTPAPPGSPIILEIDPHRAINVGDTLDPGAVGLAARLARESQSAFGRALKGLVYKQSSGLTAVLSGTDVDDHDLWVTFGDSRDYDYKVAALYVLIEQARASELPLNAVDLRFGDRLSFK